MKILWLALAGCLFLGVAGCKRSQHATPEGAPKAKPEVKKELSTQDRLIGTWELSGGEAPPGMTMEFTKEGKFKTTNPSLRHCRDPGPSWGTICCRVPHLLPHRLRTRSEQILRAGGMRVQ